MREEIKTCQNCKQEFTIEPEDFAFYEKIKVPPPTWCPACRMVRRMTWRNERTLYKRKCDATGEDIISMFDPKEPFRVYARDYWWSDAWDQMASGREYDFSKPFFAQFRELLERQPLPNLANSNVINSEYINHSHDCKNCYLIFGSSRNENVSYASGPVDCKDSYDLYLTLNVEKGYENIIAAGLYNIAFTQDSDNSFGSRFLHSCLDVNESFGCVNLRNKTNHFFNQPYTKEQYEAKLAEIDLGSYRVLSEYKKKFAEFVLQYPRRYASILKSKNATGDNIMNSKNVQSCFDVYGNLEDSKYVIHGMDLKDGYDGYGFGIGAELMYEGVDNGLNASRNSFSVFTHTCRDVSYTYCCRNSSHLFGCVGLRNKEYCILNKQYTKREYEELLPRIIAHMNEAPYVGQKGRVYRYGEFFPLEISPFSYNESIAQEYFPITREIAESRGYRWKTEEKKNYNITKKAAELPDHIKDIPDAILNEVIGCAHQGACHHQCTTAFKIIPQELQFYREMNFAFPRLCSNCRHYERIAKRNPLKLWHRSCQCAGRKSETHTYENTAPHFHGENHCPNEFKTPYAPDRPEIVYCEQCYQNEVV